MCREFSLFLFAVLYLGITGGLSDDGQRRGYGNPNCVGPCLGSTPPSGGTGGYAWDDLNRLALFGVANVAVRADGSRVHAIQITYDNGQGPQHGGNGGNPNNCVIRRNGLLDPIVQVDVRRGREINGLRFIRRSGATCGWYGQKSGGNLESFRAPSGTTLAGIYGRSGNRLDRVGFYWGRDPAVCDQVISTRGSWVNIENFAVPTGFAIQVGTQHTDGNERSEQWSNAVTTQVSAGFEFKAFTASTSVQSQFSQGTAQSYSSAFRRNAQTTTTFQFPAGTLWQWQFKTEDPCGTSTTFNDYQVTPNAYEVPCCPPGLFEDQANPLGLCVSDDVSLPVPSCPKRAK